jgi:hypothetical protein
LAIRPFLEGYKFEPETQRLMGLAFEMARAAITSNAEASPSIIKSSRNTSSNLQILASTILIGCVNTQ